MKNIRLEMNGNETRLVYKNCVITAFSPIIKPFDSKFDRYDNRFSGQGIAFAYKELKFDIQNERGKLKYSDKLAEKNNESVLELLKQKRRRFADECFESKKPNSRAKHVGVEIEFCSESSRKSISLDLAALNVAQFVELKSDSSVSSENGSGDCDGSCREECNCADCGETHYCENESDCDRRTRNYGAIRNGRAWRYREDCTECTETETVYGCDCGGQNERQENICLGEHVVCQGHCTGHYCLGYEDHENYDCSCECTCNNSESGHEIAIVAKSTQITDIVTKVCYVLQKHNAEVNSTCGLHVHIDMRGFDEKRAFSNLVKCQNLLYSMVPYSRFKNSYCSPNKSLDMDSYESRYWGINPTAYKEHGTIEIRLHSGTANAVKINNWIRLLQKIAYAKSVKQVNKLSDLTNKVKLSDTLLAYIRERMAKFENEHSKVLCVNDLAVSDVNEQSEPIAA